VGAVYERAEHTLRDEVAARIQEGKGFREKELWSILCSCAIVMAHLERKGVFYKGITPEDIFLSDDGIVKIVDPELCSISEANDLKPYYAPEFLASHR
jgi:serine/threonine protein kinase